MAVINDAPINDPDLRQIALKIVSVPDFGTSNESMRRALDAWRRALTPDKWHAVAEALIGKFLLDVRAEYERDLPAVVRPVEPAPKPVPEIRFIELEPEDADEPADAPETVLRFSSESESWSKSAVPDELSRPERLPAPPKRRTPPPSSPKFGPIIVTHVADRTPEPVGKPEPEVQTPAVVAEPEPAAKPAPVQQDGWKVPALRNMKVFPALASKATIRGATIREGQATREEIQILNDQAARQIRAYRDRITHRLATIDRRNDLTRRDEAENRVDEALVREQQAAIDRRKAADARLSHMPKGTTIEELEADVLVECGYERRSA